MKCSRCGRENSEGSVFCEFCGNRLDMQGRSAEPARGQAMDAYDEPDTEPNTEAFTEYDWNQNDRNPDTWDSGNNNQENGSQNNRIKKIAPPSGVCPNCGKPLQANALFCEYCGYRLKEDTTAPGAQSSGNRDSLASDDETSYMFGSRDPYGSRKKDSHASDDETSYMFGSQDRYGSGSQYDHETPGRGSSMNRGTAGSYSRPVPPTGYDDEEKTQYMGAMGQTAGRKISGRNSAGMVTCPKCGHVQPVGSDFCTHCGARVTKAKLPVPLIAGIAAAAVVLVIGIAVVKGRSADEDEGQAVVSSSQLTSGESSEESSSSSADAESSADEDEKTTISEEEAENLVTDQYACTPALTDSSNGVYTFECYKENNEKWGTVTVDQETGQVTVVEGMEAHTSPVSSVDPAQLSSIAGAKAGGAVYSVAVIDLEDGTLVGTDNCSTPLSSSVLIDIPILYTIMKDVNSGYYTMDQMVTFYYNNSGRGELTASDNGRQFRLDNLVQIMFRSSDNNVSNSLMDFVSFGEIYRACQAAGYTSVQIADYIGFTNDNTSYDNYVSTADLCGMLYELYQDQYFRGLMETNMHVTDSQGNIGLGSRIQAQNLMNFNGIKDNKYNEITIVENGDSAYAVAYLANGSPMSNLADGAADVGSYIQNTVLAAQG